MNSDSIICHLACYFMGGRLSMGKCLWEEGKFFHSIFTMSLHPCYSTFVKKYVDMSGVKSVAIMDDVAQFYFVNTNCDNYHFIMPLQLPLLHLFPALGIRFEIIHFISYHNWVSGSELCLWRLKVYQTKPCFTLCIHRVLLNNTFIGVCGCPFCKSLQLNFLVFFLHR